MIRIEDGPSIRLITLDEPATRNALTPALVADLETAVAEATQPVVHLTGADGVFCAGANFESVRAAAAEASGKAFIKQGQDLMTAIETASSVVVAGVTGPARGGGVELALACDIRVATPEATFAETGVALGLFGAWGGTHRLPAIVGLGDALDISLSGRTLDATEAHRIGLVQRIVGDPLETARSIADNDVGALRTIKTRLRARERPETQEAAERESFARLLSASDVGEFDG
jgi:enoyl-CoA hydratase/carnithine racemase